MGVMIKTISPSRPQIHAIHGADPDGRETDAFRESPPFAALHHLEERFAGKRHRQNTRTLKRPQLVR